MNRQTTPTDWKGATMQKRIAGRYAAERRFKAVGLGAVLLSGAFLAFLLFVMVGNGVRGFTYTHVSVPVDFKAMPLTIDTARLGDADADQVIANAGLADIVAFAADEALGADGSKLISENAWKEVRSAIKADPELLKSKTVFELPASSEVDIAAKEGAKGALGAKVDALEKDGKLSTGIHWPFFKNADATDPAVAGIWGALKGSVLTIFIAFLIAFPTGVLAALYLEEYAAKNRWTDLIEVSINNLAAVPSIIFGLLALAVFINWFGLCQASPLVGGLTLALMTMPVIVIASRNAIKSVPPSIRDAALGVGASPVQVVFHHVLPLALPGILTGTIIGMARALGETAPLLLVGMRAFIGDVPGGICSPSTVLPMQIFLWSDEVDRGFVEKTSAAIIVLLIVLLSMNAFAIYLRNKFEKRW
ncbi:phosphate ABC transporter permease PstA [Sphingopyxis macrogoltabida]|uniref:Phosphate transport system permease protein PstA n=1 Tax=Sphingopyxis macrogoltabida TaxID=33050 RepID=A0AAC8YZP6_SPHMC|nr:phosphate ABC transporter permease PstA [Sphingopyxis macrogoltabida]ALJ13271.1 phosphate ABC transporter permease [Sphingopyxis macrogoltabida]AMU89265.1 phosphate ABC transporter permease [Sphingopyxis macrogoltabida]